MFTTVDEHEFHIGAEFPKNYADRADEINLALGIKLSKLDIDSGPETRLLIHQSDGRLYGTLEWADPTLQEFTFEWAYGAHQGYQLDAGLSRALEPKADFLRRTLRQIFEINGEMTEGLQDLINQLQPQLISAFAWAWTYTGGRGVHSNAWTPPATADNRINDLINRVEQAEATDEVRDELGREKSKRQNLEEQLNQMKGKQAKLDDVLAEHREYWAQRRDESLRSDDYGHAQQAQGALQVLDELAEKIPTG